MTGNTTTRNTTTGGRWIGGILAAAAVLSTPATRADILVRTDGAPVEGRLISQTASEVVFQPDRGTPVKFDRKIVARVLAVDAHGALVSDSSAATQPAPRWEVPPEPEAPPVTPHGAGPTYYVIPLHGEVGVTVLAGALEQSLADAVARRPGVVVLDIDSPGGLVEEARKIIEVLHRYNKQMRIVALAGQDLSAAAILSLSCREIYVKATGTVGAAVAYNPANLTLPPRLEEKMQSAWRAVARNSAEEGGHEPLLAEAMIDNTMELHLETAAGKTTVKEGPGDRTLCRKGKVLTLSSHEAVECGLARGLADDFAELGKAMGMAGWTECRGLAGPLADYLPKRAAAFKSELDAVHARFARDIGDAINADPSRSVATVIRTPAPRPAPLVPRGPGMIPRPGVRLPPPRQSVTVITTGSPAAWKSDSLACVVALEEAERDLKEARSLCEAFGQRGQAEEVAEALDRVGVIRARIFDDRNRYVRPGSPPEVAATTRPGVAAPAPGPAAPPAGDQAVDVTIDSRTPTGTRHREVHIERHETHTSTGGGAGQPAAGAATIRSVADALAAASAADPHAAQAGAAWLAGADVDAPSRGKVLAVLKPHLNDADAGTRKPFVQAFARWATKDQVPDLRAVLDVPEKVAGISGQEASWAAATAGLVRLDHDAAVDALEKRIDSFFYRIECSNALEPVAKGRGPEAALAAQFIERMKNGNSTDWIKSVDDARHLIANERDAGQRTLGATWLAKTDADPARREAVLALLKPHLNETSSADLRVAFVRAYAHWADKAHVPDLLGVVDFPERPQGLNEQQRSWAAAVVGLTRLDPDAAASAVDRRVADFFFRTECEAALKPLAENDVPQRATAARLIERLHQGH